MNDATDPLAGAPPATVLSPGELLRAARERAGWTPEILAAELGLPVARLHALERDDHASFGGVVFVRGYLRRAAALLGVPAQELLTAFEVFSNTTSPADFVPTLPPGGVPRRGPPAWLGPMAGAVALVAVIGSTWWLLGPSDEGAPSAGAGAPPPRAALEFIPPEEPQLALADAVPEPLETAPASRELETVEDPVPGTIMDSPAMEAPRAEVSVVATQGTEPPPGTVELRFEFSEDCWLEVTDAEKRVLAYRLHRSGDVARLHGTAPISVFLGNAEGVRLHVDGTAVALRPARRDGTARLTVGGGAG